MQEILFHPELAEREYGSNLLYVPDLVAWLKSKQLHLRTEPPFAGFEFAQVEALLSAIERPFHSLTDEQALALVANDDRVKADERLTSAPGWVLASNAHSAWRKTLGAAISAGELVLLDFASKMPVKGQVTPAEDAPTVFYVPMFEHLMPKTEWRGGRTTDTDILTLAEAASMATKHAGTEITQNDILRAGSRGEIPLRAIIRRTAKTEPCRANDGLLNDGKPAPAGAIPTLPLSACQALASTGTTSWRTFDHHEMRDGIMYRYTRWQLTADEPDFVTVLDDCRVIGYDAHALADAFINVPEQADTVAPIPDTATSCDKPEASSMKRWHLNKPERMNTLQGMIFKVLKTAHDLNEPRAPTARDVMEAIAAAAPPDFRELSSDGLKYFDSNGDIGAATVEAISKRIKRMTEARTDDNRTLKGR